MDFNVFQDQKTTVAARLGLKLDFYCKFSIKKVAQKFSTALDAPVLVVSEDNFIPEQGKYYITEGYYLGKERYSFVCAPTLYTSARQVLIHAFSTIKEFCYTDASCIATIDFSYDKKLIKVLDVSRLNILKFILEFKEYMMWRKFPEQKNSVYVKSIKNIIPQNKFFRSENLDINNFNYILPNQNFFGVRFDRVKDGFIQFRYIGGKDYEYKITEALDMLGFYNTFLSRVLYDSTYTKKNKEELKKIISGADKILRAYDSYENFIEEYPDIKLTIDLGDDIQHIKTYYPKIRDQIFDLLASSNLNKGDINYDAGMSRIQIRNVNLHIYEIHDWEFIECEVVIESGRQCSFFGCHINNSSLVSCNVYRFSKVKNSRLKDTYINRTCEVSDTYIGGKNSTVEGNIKGGVIVGGRLGNYSKISKETELVDYTKVYVK